MRIFLTFLIDTLFPPSPEARIVRALTEHDLHRHYIPRTVGDITSLTPFTSPTIRALIHEAKFCGNRDAQKLLGSLLAHHMDKRLEGHALSLIPIPLSMKRERERGQNQVTRILEHTVAKLPHATLQPMLLTRVKHTRPQTELGREERRANMRGAFHAPYPDLIRGKHLILIDDVTTTGATLKAARDALLLHHPASVTLIALAH